MLFGPAWSLLCITCFILQSLHRTHIHARSKCLNSVNLLEIRLVAESNCVHQDELKDQGVFMLSLASLIELETSFDDDLLDLYLYYCVVGLGMASPRLQSAALAMLQSCAVQQPALVVAKLPLVNTLCKRYIHALTQLLLRLLTVL